MNELTKLKINQLRLSDEDFAYVYSKVPRLNVDLVVRVGDSGIVLVKRSIEPNIGSWHLPGGTVYKGETLAEASTRVTKNETGFDADVVRTLGSMEFPEEKRGDIVVHTVSIVVEVKVTGGELKHDSNAKEIAIVKQLPSQVITEHFLFLKENKILE